MIYMEVQQIEEKLKTALKPSRYRHTLGVAYTASCMAMVFGVDVHKAYRAGLLHDCAKGFSMEEQRALCKRYNISLEGTLTKSPQLMHQEIAPFLASDEYNEQDSEVLSAIACHTTGKIGMTPLEQIVFIADYMEPNRKMIPGLSKVRKLAFEDLDKCTKTILKNTIEYTLQPNRSIEFRVTDDFGSFSPPHWHDALEIIYILEGSSIVTLSDRTKTVLPGQFLLINSGRIHTARCPSTGNRSILMQIPDAFLANYLPDPSQLWFSIDYDSTNPEVQKNISQFRRLLLSMMQLHEEMPDGYLLTFQRELFTFLDLLYTKFSEKSPLAHHPMSSRTQTRLDTILTYTQENYQRPITLKEAADVVSLQPEYFCRFFRQNMETTYLEYLNSYRLSRIYRDLIATDLPVGTLAEKHGFTNDKLFHRLFRERFHTTPLQLRKAAREKGS